ncbi:MAG: hypothetical protein AB7S26_30790 [Sandaracinaceae bacterium]
MNGSASWQVVHWMPLPRPPWMPDQMCSLVSGDASLWTLSAGCGTCKPSSREPSAFWKKQVRPVYGLCPIIAMS